MPAVLDGLGWLVGKTGLLMRTYGWTRDYILDELDGAEGWVWFNWAQENEASVWGTGVKVVGSGYIGQEKQRLLKEQNGKR